MSTRNKRPTKAKLYRVISKWIYDNFQQRSYMSVNHASGCVEVRQSGRLPMPASTDPYRDAKSAIAQCVNQNDDPNLTASQALFIADRNFIHKENPHANPEVAIQLPLAIALADNHYDGYILRKSKHHGRRWR